MTQKNDFNYARIDDSQYVDTNFVNLSKGKLANSELVHLGMGDFALKTNDGDIFFYRMNSKPSPTCDNFVGRCHRMIDNRDGFLIDQLLTKMNQ